MRAYLDVEYSAETTGKYYYIARIANDADMGFCLGIGKDLNYTKAVNKAIKAAKVTKGILPKNGYIDV